MDVHKVTGELLAPNDKDPRKIGKTLNFASIYGAQAEKISITAGVSVKDAQSFLDDYWIKLPGVLTWKNSALLLAQSRGGVTTMSGRFIPLPDLKSRNRWKRMHAERAAINYIIQGSAADIIKVAMIELDKQGYKPLLQVHDELIFEVDPSTADAEMQKIKQIMENVVKLSVPILADAHIGSDWNEAKGD
jgi:DNA polymerase-1